MKKKVIALVAALSLVAAVGAGSTLAYLQDETAVVRNTFTMGDVQIVLTETVDEVEDLPGHDYTNLLPGQTVDKNPIVTVLGGSEDSMIYALVSAVDANLTVDYNEANWELVKTNNDGSKVYKYFVMNGNDKNYAVSVGDDNLDLPAVFTSVTVNSELEETTVLADIKVIAYAIQAELFGDETAEADFVNTFAFPEENNADATDTEA